MDFAQILYDVDGPVATITMNRPERLNAFTITMQREMVAALDLADADDDVRAVIVTGAGKGFCAGADLGGGGETFNAEAVVEATGGGSPTPEGNPYPRDFGGLLTLRIFRMIKPVIAAINGAAVGIGATMTLPMDVRLAADDAKLGFVFAGRGIVPEAASSWFLPRVVGISQALEWTMTARVFPAEEGLRGGLIRSLHPKDDLLPAARALAEEIATNAAPVSVALTRQMLWRMLGADHPMVAHRVDSRGVYSTGRSVDAREGVMAFLEKRPASWAMRPSTDMPEWYPWWHEPEYE
ncbi:crotonase/enoyl-CoA hydratase family protein [Rhabdothermincola sediminis]|uniref:crotonase/enoyl-CoA hydratase family protein n=1 Tax=Rhabdothermincola sediminis TaxID=2751370 RepID=UPI001AA041CF|nr:crotonase/enoyl-CoA hydratase family protein [Rhabdothermincola sediminis]